ncbi:alpha-1,4-glucan--maltose-1-phosphate maltosyltransferase [Schaalia sp. ZJ405]|uniref:alpha-1,4-glucan--maltose-1-phosphate maltosyltransferase n=1 Tax=unclassified Schaalia TaxID=2691889 RepID=UPI0013EE3145|nr:MULTISPECIES: alpha-1,4-glucan--maltose-1-phosphate maltosyltransferase [unclassified Schaalia]QPK80604.1 alpha-1,4-glucan--maltose-1-phosphate maltosyltransferase [Schaalia sp. ZJ405]
MTESLIPRIPAIELFPVIEDATLAAKATENEPFPIRATVFREGHDSCCAEAVLIDPEGREYSRTLMSDIAPGLDRYEAWVVANRPGAWSFCVETWSNPYATWQHDATVKIDAGIDVELMLEEGARLLERAIAGHALNNPTQKPADAQDAAVLRDAAAAMRNTQRSAQQRLSAGVSSEVRAIFRDHPLRDLLGHTRRYPLDVSRERALTGSWYELFPRSAGAFQKPDGTWVSGTLRHAADDLDRIADMGFNVVYLTPIHPIGTTHRKGRNNTLEAQPGDPGSPYGIGSDLGGHDAIHPDLGDFDDFDAFVARARELDMEVALDIALQCSPDHPWVTEHPEWFTMRADGSIAYAENPPKKYQDIYPLNFDNDPKGIYRAIRDVFLTWIRHGVTIFRVDNPHTKPVPFWQEIIADIKRIHPEVIFLAEAFTRPAMMRTLGSVGFDQSYTYFAWRTGKEEICDYLTEVSTQTAHMMRPTFWPTTHDILTPQMTTGGTAIFAIRAMLAALGCPNWGIYSGYEFVENVQRPGFEEHNDNEKYEFRPRRWEDAEPLGISQLLTLLNRARAKHPALRQLHQIRIHPTSHPELVCFSRQIPGRFTATGQPDTVICVISLNPHHGVDGSIHLDLSDLGIENRSGRFTVVDELDGSTYTWSHDNYVSLSPVTRLGHVMAVQTPENSWALSRPRQRQA